MVVNRPRSLRMVAENPYNGETPLPALAEAVTPLGLVFIRNRFAVPQLNANDWKLGVHGEVRHGLSLSLRDIQSLPARTLTLMLECAGNARTRMQPLPTGVGWDYGAASIICVTGTPVSNLLAKAGVSEYAVEALFVGADRGEAQPGRVESYCWGLPLALAMHPDTLLAWEMNGEPLTPDHGYPLRLVVPGLYGMASVKWLTEINLVAKPHRGFFQGEHYLYLDEAGTPHGEPVAEMRVRSLILECGNTEIRGIAWSGYGTITRVEVSMDGGDNWLPAKLDPAESSYGGRRWRHRWTPETGGTYTLSCRATDSLGNSQPANQRWNSHGYGNNGPHSIEVNVAPRSGKA